MGLRLGVRENGIRDNNFRGYPHLISGKIISIRSFLALMVGAATVNAAQLTVASH